MDFQRLFIFSILLSFGLCQSVSVEDLLAAGQCEPFDDFPIACQAVMVDAWSSIWTAPSYGLTQEYFVGQMNIVDPQLGMSPIDLVNVLPSNCAFQYLKMICPTFLRPCTFTNSSPLIPPLPPAIPHSVCRSVCEELKFSCWEFLSSNDIDFSCNRSDPLTALPLYPNDFDTPKTEPFSCTRIENFLIHNLTYPCPPPSVNHGSDHDITGVPCALSCHDFVNVIFKDRNNHAMFITYSILSWISFIAVSITLIVYVSYSELRKWPSRIAIYVGISLWLFHLSAVGDSFLSFTDLKCESFWNFDYHHWCKASAWLFFFGSLSACFWWLFQSLLVFWNIVLLRFNDNNLKIFEPLFHVISWGYPFIATCVLSWAYEDTTGGSLNGTPWCAFGLGYGFDSQWIIFGPICFSLVCVFIMMLATIIKIVSLPIGGEDWRAALGDRSKNLVIILGFLLVYMNSLIATVALTFHGQDYSPQYSKGLQNYMLCVLTTTGNTGDCVNTYPLYQPPYWYATISASLPGLGYAIVYLICKSNARSKMVESFTRRSSKSIDTPLQN